jgi:chromosome segregation ATPase
MSIAGDGVAGGGGSSMLDLALLATSTPDFQKRILELATAKKDAEKAFNDLKVGKDAAVVYERASAKEAEAKEKLVEANAEYERILAKGAADAKSTLDGAYAKADAIVARAEAKAAKLTEATETANAEAVAAAEEAKVDAKALKEELRAVKSERAGLDAKCVALAGQAAEVAAREEQLAKVAEKLRSALGEL